MMEVVVTAHGNTASSAKSRAHDALDSVFTGRYDITSLSLTMEDDPSRLVSWEAVMTAEGELK